MVGHKAKVGELLTPTNVTQYIGDVSRVSFKAVAGRLASYINGSA
ncbi:hypothetical protein SAMCFNEI73_pB0219 (plasmid) [Sinorhizobium americanum]|uniref:Uncharacterized protein n=1 Tax=Sinorhizobium americanum TaxID=194963 RepID=A0A1L3LTN7_9HYPH|nr:hypothetical protein SAMCFNEI73_pB0219 [Sinorhizobium americanum]